MADINHVTLVGRLTRDCELKYTSGGQAVCKFGIAVNRRRKNGDQWEDEANFFDIVLWGRQGESLKDYLQKGKQVGIDGELKQDRWQKDGQNHSKVEIIANNVQLLGGGGGGGGSYSGGNSGGGSANYGGSSGNADNSSGGNGGQPWQGQGASQSAPADDGYADDIPF